MSVNSELTKTFLPERLLSVWLVVGTLGAVGIGSRTCKERIEETQKQSQETNISKG